jgi:hypothetical protein
MENKQKAIQEAYGEHWETVKDYVDENGWCAYHFGEHTEYGIEPFLDFETKDYKFWRPKSLKGIETNNGWIKIESEADLPKDKTTQYSVCKDKKVFQSTINCGTVKHWYNIGKITHYQPIIKPKPPIY